jgi:predicted O-linked N-acetylglucosamine transferase (SPINDLY family)
LTAAGLPELTTTTLEAYEELAVELATNPEKLAAIKSRLGRNRMTAPLFNTQLLVGQIEAAYTAMYARYQANLPPERMDVAIGSKERPNS